MFYIQNISIYMNFLGGQGGRTWSTVHFVFIIPKKNGKSTRAWPKLKSNSTSFWFKKNLPRMKNKKNNKMGLLNFKERGARRRCNWAKMSMVALCGTPHTVWTISYPLRNEGTLCQKYTLFYHSFRSQHLPFHTSNLCSSSSFHHKIVGQVALYPGITRLYSLYFEHFWIIAPNLKKIKVIFWQFFLNIKFKKKWASTEYKL